jgi:hypothetical protein
MKRALLVVCFLLLSPLAIAQAGRPNPENIEHLKNFQAQIQLGNYAQAIAESEKMKGGRPDFPTFELPALALAHEQTGNTPAALAALQRLRDRLADGQKDGLLMLVTNLESRSTKIKDSKVKAEFDKLLLKLPPRKQL